MNNKENYIDTKNRILDVAGKLFATQGIASTIAIKEIVFAFIKPVFDMFLIGEKWQPIFVYGLKIPIYL